MIKLKAQSLTERKELLLVPVFLVLFISNNKKNNGKV